MNTNTVMKAGFLVSFSLTLAAQAQTPGVWQ